MHRVGLHVLEHLEHMRTQRLGMVGTHMTASPTVRGSAGWARRQVARFIVPAEPAPSSHCVCVCVCARARARVCVCVIRATFPCLGPEERARFLCSGPCLAEGTASLNHREALQPPDARGRRTRLKNKQIFIMYLMQNPHQLSLPHTQAHPVVK